jgi:hypothetical protein
LYKVGITSTMSKSRMKTQYTVPVPFFVAHGILVGIYLIVVVLPQDAS